MKRPERLQLLEQKIITPGTYECTVPGCPTHRDEDGFCPTHDVPLRLLKRKP